MAATDVATYGILADAVRPRYAAISALPSRQQFLYFVALCVRANRAYPTQHSSLFPPPSGFRDSCWERPRLVCRLSTQPPATNFCLPLHVLTIPTKLHYLYWPF